MEYEDDSSSDPDHKQPAPGPRRRRSKRKILMQIEYEDDNSESDDDDDDDRKNIQKQASCSEVSTKMLELSDHSVWEEDWLSDTGAAPSGSKVKQSDEEEDSDSSSSSSSREKCPICLFSFTTQEVGQPESCTHKFCAICIEEWSKNVSTCPIDRKEFHKIICLQDFLTPTVTREITVEVTRNREEEVAVDIVDDDLTYCRICNRSDREESMLLCDGCNHGYHMECLVPAMEEVPTEFWYCDDCFASNEDDDPGDELALQEEIAELMEEVREFGIPETRLRIRTEAPRNSPRILRTRQSERIREAILARTNRRTFREATREVAAEDMVAMPGPSRMHTSVRIVRSINTPATSSSSNARRRTTTGRCRRRVNRRTVVVEYDVDHEDDKFAIKTKKIYKKIKRRRRKKRNETQRPLVRNCTRSANTLTGAEFSNQFSAVNKLELCNDATKDGLTLSRMRAGIPKLSITGIRNALEYYSSNDDEEEEQREGAMGGGAGGLMMATRNRTLGGNLRSMRNRKAGLIIPDSALPSTVDVLGSIMSEQERWMNISNPRNISKIKINPDGRLEYEGDYSDAKKSGRGLGDNRKLPVVSAAAAGVSENISNGRSSGSNLGAANDSGNNGGQRTVATEAPANSANSNGDNSGNLYSAGPSTGSNGNTGVATFPDIRTAAARKAPPVANLKVLGDDTDDENDKKPSVDSSDEDCPNFAVYSAETMELAKNISEPVDETAKSAEGEQLQNEGEREEDLVQLDDDEEMEMEVPKEESAEKKGELELHDDSDWDELNSDRAGTGGGEEAKPATGESKAEDPEETQKVDERNQLNTESISEDEEVEMVVNDSSRRSLTPCLDEKSPEIEPEQEPSAANRSQSKEELELISDDEMAEQNINSGAGSGIPKETTEKSPVESAADRLQTDVDEFKRLSKTTKERNYRDKDRRSNSPKRRRSDKKREAHSPSSRSRNRRKDLERYDVRHVIAERKQRPDKYGRDTAKHKRSRSKSNSSSLSSLSPDEARRSRSRSRRRRSRSKSPRRNRSRHSRSPKVTSGGRRERSPIRPRHSRSPGNRKRRSLSRFTMSPSMSRSPTPVRTNRGSPRRGGRQESPARTSRNKPQSPLRMKNGRSERKKENQSPVNRRRSRSPDLHSKSISLAQKKRRRSRSLSSSSPVKQKAKPRYVEPETVKSWTPPLRNEDRIVDPAGKVVVKNSGAPKKDKKAKRKKVDKKRSEPVEKGRKEKRKKKQSTSKSAGPSKEVFASGDNILVSVNFSSKRSPEAANPPTQTTIVTLPPSKDQIVTQKQRQEKQQQRQREKGAAEARGRNSNKSKRPLSPRGTTLVVTKNRRHRKVDAKPVAIIDLDGSPFRVMTPSPKAVIVLSDSEGDGGERKSRKSKKSSPDKDEAKKGTQGATQSSKADGAFPKRSAASTANAAAKNNSNEEVIPLATDEDDMVLEMPNKSTSNVNSIPTLMIDNSGPKTPPEPTMKFSMAMRSKSNVIRALNPLHDAREEEDEQAEQQQKQEENNNNNGTKEATALDKDQLVSTTPPIGNIGDATVDPGTGSTNNHKTVAGESREVAMASNVNNLPTSSTNNNGGGSNKIGPNTPPEPAPTSPDAYDPFEPTKSNSQSPAQDMDMASNNEVDQRPVKIVTSPRHKDLRTLDEHKGKIPVSDLVLKLLNSTAGHHHPPPPHHMSDMGMVGTLSPPPPPPPYLEKSLNRASETHSKGITILSNVIIQPGKGLEQSGGASTQLSSSSSLGKSMKHGAAFSTMNSTTTSYSIMKQMQTEAKRMLCKQKATPPVVTTATVTTCTPTLTQAMLKKHNAECTLMDIAAESPYSPGSSDFDDLFEPPTDTAPSSSRIPSLPTSGPSPMKGGTKTQTELFDSLFGSHSPPQPGQKSWTPIKSRKPSGRGHSSSHRRSSHGRKHLMEDDVPDSAVDMVLKENYIKKLNRQERVVEEVKIVLRPHFRRKYITKEDYKEIMKKSVSKICNSRSGEINPQKIKAFIDAYVQKYRYRRKYGSAGGNGGAASSTVPVASSNSMTMVTSSSSSLNISSSGVLNQNK